MINNNYQPLGDVFASFDRIFDQTLRGSHHPRVFQKLLNPGARGFALDLLEQNDAYLVRAELPGFQREEIQLKFEDGALSICASRKGDSEGQGEAKQSLERIVPIPDEIQRQTIGATLENGILTVRLPKAEAATPVEIEIR
ncbi:MAG: Hsp20/alpha crystallin family protein [Puniceicoccaceae bacterium]